MTPPASSRQSATRLWLALAILLVAALAFNLVLAFRMPVWLDEAHTYWIIRDGFGAVFAKLREDVHPPLYFCLTTVTTAALGIQPWALRLPSVLAAIGTILATYWTARTFLNRGWAFGSALLVATHPLFNYYASEARNYSLFLFLLTATIGTIVRTATGARPMWVLLGVLLTLLLQAQNLALFVFPPLLLAAGILAGEKWRPVVLRLLGLQAIAFALYLPWFVTAVGAEGGIAWITNFWNVSDKWTLPLRSLLGFGPGAEYPEYLGPPGNIRGIPLLGAVLTGLLLLGSVAAPRVTTPSGSADRPPRAITGSLWLGVGSLLLLWSYSWIRQPIYLVGRYDLTAFPFVVLLLGLGAHTISRRAGRWFVGASLLAAALAVNIFESAQLLTNLPKTSEQPEDVVVRFMTEKGSQPGDLVVTKGNIAFLILRYAGERAGHEFRFITFPAAVARHPGWYEGERFLREPAALQKDADATAREVAAALARGNRVWLVDDGHPKVDEFLVTALRQVASPNLAESKPELRIFSLRAR